jgi:hypothetical protein
MGSVRRYWPNGFPNSVDCSTAILLFVFLWILTAVLDESRRIRNILTVTGSLCAGGGKKTSLFIGTLWSLIPEDKFMIKLLV